MGSVIPRAGGKRNKLIYLAIFAVYAIAAYAFIAIGLQPVRSADAAYAEESTQADATLNIDSISLTAPVMQSTLTGNELSVPDQIAASYSAAEHKILIFGHSSTIFQNLHNIKNGDIVNYHDRDYRVVTITEKLKSDVSMSEILAPASKDTIILMTCSGDQIPNSNGDHTHRLIITAESL